ncbi:ABC transporter ATP-binding protein [Paracoccus shandongensis]|uniref:ABC transporter ATP-binding protein n=1 Tax=Paracoccus shandongensis TaxID=2816048 RepID=UPI001A8E3930|nr:ABC transporter ATP-binding protein [Paracoccus shandongensis]
MLTVDHLNVWFGHPPDRVDAVQDASFTVAPGESFGLVGESGSGKSTILRAVAGLIDTWSGTIAVAGKPLTARKRDRAFYKTVQMVFQDPYASLHPRHSVDVVLSETLRLQGMDDIDRRIARLLDDVGLGRGFRFRYPHQLSGGQRQRVAIARALAAEPRLLLLDEPTSALDVSVQAEILNLLADLRAEHGLTYVMVSHDLAVVGHMCDRLAVMQAGRIVEVMDVQALRRGSAQQDYTRRLIAASEGYARA